MKQADILYNMINLAIPMHGSQVDRYGNKYFLHPLRVMSNFWDDLDCAIVAVGHDLFEDTECTVSDLKKAGCTNTHIAAMVLLTKGENEAYDLYIKTICHYIEFPHELTKNTQPGIIAAKVKIADMRDNMGFNRSCGEPLIPDNKVGKFPIYRDSYNKLVEALKKATK